MLVKLPNSLNDCDTAVFGAYVCALATTSLIASDDKLPFGTWRRLIRPPDLGFAVSLAAPPLQMLTVPLLISLLRISLSSSSGLYCDDMPCALYHMLFAVVKWGETLSSDVQIRSRKSVLLILSIHSEKINVCCLQHIGLIRRIHCLKHGLRLIDVNVRAGRS